MAFPRKLLNQNEELVLDLNPHWIALAAPVAGLVAAIIVGLLVAVGWQPDGTFGKIIDGLVALVVLAALVYFLWKLAVWKTTHFVVTNTRLISGRGVLSKSRKEIPIDRVNDVSFHQGLFERMVGAGTLTIESAGERGQEMFTDVNHPDRVQAHIYAQMEAREQRRFHPQAAVPAAPVAPVAPAPPVTQVAADSPADSAPTGVSQPSVTDQIAELHELLTKGAISQAEFDAKKAQLLDRM